MNNADIWASIRSIASSGFLTEGLQTLDRYAEYFINGRIVYQLSKKNPKDHAKFMCAAGEGIVPWKEVKRLLDMHKVKAPFAVHFEYKFDEKDLLKTVKGELDFFKGIFA